MLSLPQCEVLKCIFSMSKSSLTYCFDNSCCTTIVAEEVQKQQEQGAEDAEHELRDLKKVKVSESVDIKENK